MKTFLPQNLNSRQEAESFLTDLYNNEEEFDPMVYPEYWFNSIGDKKLTPKECLKMSVLIHQIQYYGIDILDFFNKMDIEDEEDYCNKNESPEFLLVYDYNGTHIKFWGLFFYNDYIILN